MFRKPKKRAQSGVPPPEGEEAAAATTSAAAPASGPRRRQYRRRSSPEEGEEEAEGPPETEELPPSPPSPRLLRPLPPDMLLRMLPLPCQLQCLAFLELRDHMRLAETCWAARRLLHHEQLWGPRHRLVVANWVDQYVASIDDSLKPSCKEKEGNTRVGVEERKGRVSGHGRQERRDQMDTTACGGKRAVIMMALSPLRARLAATEQAVANAKADGDAAYAESFAARRLADAEQERVQQLQRRLRREREEMWRLSHGGGESEAAAPLLLRTAEAQIRMLINDIRAAKRLHTHHEQRAFDSNVEMMSARMDEHVAERERSRLTRVLKSLALALKATEEIRPPVA